MKNVNIQRSHILRTARYNLRIPTVDDIPRIFSATRYEGFNDGMLWEPPATEDELLIPLKATIKA